MRGPSTADEAHRSGARTVARRCLLFHGNHFRTQRQAKITVRVHAQERFLTLAFDEIARPSAIPRGYDCAVDTLPSFQPSALRHLIKACSQHFAQSLGWHRSLALCISRVGQHQKRDLKLDPAAGPPLQGIGYAIETSRPNLRHPNSGRIAPPIFPSLSFRRTAGEVSTF